MLLILLNSSRRIYLKQHTQLSNEESQKQRESNANIGASCIFMEKAQKESQGGVSMMVEDA